MTTNFNFGDIITIDKLSYKIISLSLLEVEVTKNSKCRGYIDIPSSVNYQDESFAVTSIGTSAFDYCCDLSSITFPLLLTHIGESAFRGCGSLTSITLPDVEVIGDKAFQGVPLKNIFIPDSVVSIGSWAFDGTDLTSVEIPESVREIGEGAFSNCDSLTSVSIPSSVTKIGEMAFAMNRKLTTIVSYIDADIENVLSSYNFTHSSNLTLYVPEGTLEAYKSSNWTELSKNIVEIDD